MEIKNTAIFTVVACYPENIQSKIRKGKSHKKRVQENSGMSFQLPEALEPLDSI
jgi:hypothetical protein